MIGVLAAARAPERFGKLVLVGPSPRYIDDEGYRGGFSRADIDELLDSMDANFLGWSTAMAPAIMGNADRPELGEELTESFCRTDPDIAARFARVTFLSDNRADLAAVTAPTLVLQCSDDVIAPDAVGALRARADPGLGLRAAGGDRPLPEPERAARRPIDAIRALRLSEQSAEDLYENAPCGYLSATPGGQHRARQRHLPALDGLRARGPRRRPALPGPADRRRPDLPRDALRAAAADAGQRARDRRRHRVRRRRAGCPCWSTRC